MSELEDYFLDLPRTQRSRIYKIVDSLNFDRLDQLQIMSESALFSLKRCGPYAYQQIRRAFPYDESIASRLTLGEILQAHLYDPDLFANALLEAWGKENFRRCITYMQCIIAPIPEIDGEAFRYTSPYRERSIAARLDLGCLEKDSKAIAYLLAQLLPADRYQAILKALVSRTYSFKNPLQRR